MTATFLEQPGVFLFTVSALLIAAYVAIELVGVLLVGSGVGHLLDGLLPGHVHADVGAAADGALAKAFGWLYLGRVPLMILIMLFLGGFAALGLALQGALHALAGETLPALLAYPAGLLGGLSAVRLCAPPIARLLAVAGSSGTSEIDFIGAIGIVTVGTMTAELASTVRVRAPDGQVHYLTAKALNPGDALPEGTEVVVQAKSGAFYQCVGTLSPRFDSQS